MPFIEEVEEVSEKELKAIENVQKLTSTLIRDHPEYMLKRNNAVLLGERLRVDAAMSEFEQALQAYQQDRMKSLDPQFPINTYNEMGVLLSKHGRHGAAIQQFRTSVQLAENLPTESKENLQLFMDCTENLVNSLRAANRPGDAIPVYQKLLVLNSAGPLASTEKEADVLYSLAEVFNDLKRYEAAEPLARRCLQLRSDTHGADTVCAPVAMSLVMLAAIIAAPSIAKYPEAESMCRKAIEMARKSKVPFTQQTKAEELAGMESVYGSIVRAQKRAKKAMRRVASRAKHAPSSNTRQQQKQQAAQRQQQKQQAAASGACGNNCGVRGTLRCGRCKTTFYCSPGCQRAAWKVHKKQCQAPT